MPVFHSERNGHRLTHNDKSAFAEKETAKRSERVKRVTSGVAEMSDF